MSVKGSGSPNQMVVHQADAAISRVNPVSGTFYPVLSTTNARLISIAINVTWAVTQPTNLTLKITIDDNMKTFTVANPVSTQNYRPFHGCTAGLGGLLFAFDNAALDAGAGAFFLEGRKIVVEAAITWAVTQPTPLVCLVQYARLP